MHDKDSVRTALIADDDAGVRELLETVLAEGGWQTESVSNGSAAIERLCDGFDVALVDVRMPGASGHEVLAAARVRAPELPVLMLSGDGDVEDAVRAIQSGARDFLSKPFQTDALVARLGELAVSPGENGGAEDGRFGRVPDLVAESGEGIALMGLASRCARVDATVLIAGASGTGKSILARWIHERGGRSAEPFVSVNCGALPRDLIEAELFGHERGAFTGATASRAGLFEAADGGTLFLDEIGELPLDLQPKLLSVLQDRQVTRIGGTKLKRVDVRIIAASNQDLAEAVGDRRFREDLFYRLNVLRLCVPSLRDRRADVVPLARHHLVRIALRVGVACPRLTTEACDALAAHTWPGNVRELENVLERAVVFATGGVIGPAELGDLRESNRDGETTGMVGGTLAEMEQRAILETLDASGGNRAEAARRLGISERTVYNRLREYGAVRSAA